MPDAHRPHDLRLLLGLLGAAACGPGAPAMTGDGTGGSDTSAGPGTDPTDPTGSTTLPPACQSDADCGGDCDYCLDGACQVAPGCCGYAEVSPGAALQWRCSPPYQCYSDEECGDGYVCELGECVVRPIVVLPPCTLGPLAVESWALEGLPGALGLADLDGDLDLDLVAALPATGELQLTFNDGLGNFNETGFALAGGPVEQLGFVAGDLEGDGDIDLVAIRGGAPGGLVLIFSHDGAFTSGDVLPAADDPQQAFIADIDGDGNNDIITVHSSVPEVEVRAGDGAGNFTAPANGGVDNLLDPRATVVDLNADGRVDLVAPIVLGTFGGVWFGQPDATFTMNTTLDARGPDLAAFAADLALSGLQSVVFAREGGTVAVWPAVAPGAWQSVPLEFMTSSTLLGGVMADFDGEGGPDLVSATGTATVSVLLGDGHGGFACELVQPVDHDSARPLLAVGDIDGDGRTDLLSATPQLPALTVVRQ